MSGWRGYLGIGRVAGLLRKEQMDMKGSCETCAFYEYDEEYDYYVCSASLDEDEMARFLQDSHFQCPYYRLGDEYAVVRKQM